MAVTGADFLLKALILQCGVGVFTAENPWQFSGLTPSMGSLKTSFLTDGCVAPALENCHTVAQLGPQVFGT